MEVDKAEAAIEEMVEVEVCETIKPKKKNATDANATEVNLNPKPETIKAKKKNATDANATEVWRVLARALSQVCIQKRMFVYTSVLCTHVCVCSACVSCLGFRLCVHM